MHAGLPSVINDFLEYRSLNAEFAVGLLVRNEDAEILKALEALMNNADTHARCVLACLQAQKAWNWQIESEVLLQIYADNHG